MTNLSAGEIRQTGARALLSLVWFYVTLLNNICKFVGVVNEKIYIWEEGMRAKNLCG